ncbi:hypothetical protein [Embleya sp. NPDC059237]|uniref:hypothetical protein n=1 Tax=Embleya sp. NPDC059237 TaxID=3346784 RepID=UPI00367DF4F3
MSIKVTVIYHDTDTCVRAMADAVAAVAWNTGADIRLRRLPEAEPAAPRDGTKADPLATVGDLTWPDVVILGAPARDGDIVALLHRLTRSATASASDAAARDMRDSWQRRSCEQVFGVFVTSPAPDTRHGGLMRSFAIIRPRFPTDDDPHPRRSIATLTEPTTRASTTDDPTLLSLDLARIQTRRCVELAALLRADRVLVA